MIPNATQPAMQVAPTFANKFWKRVDTACGFVFFVLVFGGGVFAPIAFFINGLMNK